MNRISDLIEWFVHQDFTENINREIPADLLRVLQFFFRENICLDADYQIDETDIKPIDRITNLIYWFNLGHAMPMMFDGLHREDIDIVVQALEEKRDRDNNFPITLQELSNMKGQLVWLEWYGLENKVPIYQWATINKNVACVSPTTGQDKILLFEKFIALSPNDIGVRWNCYRWQRSLETSDRDRELLDIKYQIQLLQDRRQALITNNVKD